MAKGCGRGLGHGLVGAAGERGFQMKRRRLAMVVAALGVLLLTGCGGGDRQAAGEQGPVVIHYPTFQCGVNTAAPVVDQLIDEFNRLHAGVYEIQKEDVPGDANYVNKIKVQLATGKLPPVVYGGGYDLLSLALARDMVVDLTDAVNADPQWRALYTEEALALNSKEGRVYASSAEGSLIGYYYNKELFAQAGIEAPAATWEEFFQQCQLLKDSGVAPLALDTADSAWVTQLWWGAMVATEDETGLTFMRQRHPDDYNFPQMVHAVDQVRLLLQEYATQDAVGGRYENAAVNFLSGQAAMIANGPWMMNDFTDLEKTAPEFAQQVGVAIYPGGFVYDAPVQGYFVTRQKDPAVEKAAVEMVRFFTSAHAQEVALELQGMIPASPTVAITDGVREKYPLLAELLRLSAQATVRSDNMQSTMWPNLLDVVSRELPLLATGALTPEAFCRQLSDGAAQNSEGIG